MASKLFPPNDLTQPSPPSLPLSPFRPHLSRPTHTTTATHLDTSIPAATEPQIPAMSNSSPTLSSSPSDRRNSVEWGTSLPHLPPSPIPHLPPQPSPTSPPANTPPPTDASKVPPSRFQKRKGSIYAVPSSRDGHVDSNYNTKFHEKHKELWKSSSDSTSKDSSSKE